MIRFAAILTTGLLVLSLPACSQQSDSSPRQNASATSDPAMMSSQTPAQPIAEPRKDGLKEATFGSGCFWCTEAFFENLEGVKDVVSGYSGGFVKNPSYKEVCGGRTGHAEVTRIVFDPELIDFATLLEVFWATHDPTTLNRQGNDVGPQYRSAIFYHDEEQRRIAEISKQAAEESGTWNSPIVTEISPLVNWYPAEDYHQDYYANNPNQPYCAYVIRPKMDKFNKLFGEKLQR